MSDVWRDGPLEPERIVSAPKAMVLPPDYQHGFTEEQKQAGLLYPLGHPLCPVTVIDDMTPFLEDD